MHTNTAAAVIAAIIAADRADEALAGARVSAADALTNAAITTHAALGSKVSLRSIADEAKNQGIVVSKDTVSRLGVVGSIIVAQPDLVAAEGEISVAHHLRRLINQAVNNGVGLADIRTAGAEADPIAAIAALAQPQAKAKAAAPSMSDGESDGESEGGSIDEIDEVPTPETTALLADANRALAAAVVAFTNAVKVAESEKGWYADDQAALDAARLAIAALAEAAVASGSIALLPA
jgi:hypothetical protein